MENIGNFLKWADRYGVDKGALFKTMDLIEGQSSSRVKIQKCILAVSRVAAAKGFSPVMAESSQEPEINQNVPRAGSNFGKTRQILD